MSKASMDAPEFLSDYAQQVETGIKVVLAERSRSIPNRLLAAMEYALLAGGKRVRPALLMACFHACGGKDDSSALSAAISIECMHTYSLIHDDLPCMDDDDLRRGNPTCHKQYDEATAVLAADALQTMAFELLATSSTEPDMGLELLRRLAIASGAQGMVGGQMMDMQADSEGVSSVLEVERIHLHKTGALIRYSCEAGALLAGADEVALKACSRYGEAVGLLFQIADDILDATATSEALGKSAGKDEVQHKATYVSLEGLSGARDLAEDMQKIALEACAAFDKNSEPLKALAHYILERGQ